MCSNSNGLGQDAFQGDRRALTSLSWGRMRVKAIAVLEHQVAGTGCVSRRLMFSNIQFLGRDAFHGDRRALTSISWGRIRVKAIAVL